jgi:protein tyrosine phosphatase (PTP) superfamily phosphohydrolase (DUF442 family)
VPAPPQSWTADELERDAAASRRRFVDARLAALEREREAYDAWIERFAGEADRLLQATADLRRVTGDALRERALLDVARYATAPVISLDDLDSLTDSGFRAWVGQRTDRGRAPDPPAFAAAARVIAERIDPARAPWLSEGRTPTPAERRAFVRATASVRAMSALATRRRIEGSRRQEEATRLAAQLAGYRPVSPPGTLTDPIAEMPPGSFAVASRRLGGTSMDVPVRLRVGHPTGLLFVAVEAKVSNSTINSRKRLLEVTRKRETWDASGQVYSFRTAAVLAGSFDVRRLLEAQEAGVMLFWEHRLEDLTAFLRG